METLEGQFGTVVLNGLERQSEGQIMKVRMERDQFKRIHKVRFILFGKLLRLSHAPGWLLVTCEY